MTNELIEADQYPLTSSAVVARVRLIQEVMAKVMKKDTHYGVIPGCAKPSLWKPGAEQLLVTFRIAPSVPKVEDLSTPDSVRYRVTRDGVSNGSLVASGVGECSSDEEKYKWRKPVCQGEYDATAEDRRRMKWTKDGSSYPQVRTNPADVANTILKMADKRAFVAMTLLATAASDIFTQDLEDLPAEIAEAVGGEGPTQAPPKGPSEKTAPTEGTTESGKAFKTAIFVPFAATSKPTKKEGQTRYAIKDDRDVWFSTFDDAIGKFVLSAREQKAKIVVNYTVQGAFNSIVDARVAE